VIHLLERSFTVPIEKRTEMIAIPVSRGNIARSNAWPAPRETERTRTVWVDHVSEDRAPLNVAVTLEPRETERTRTVWVNHVSEDRAPLNVAVTLEPRETERTRTVWVDHVSEDRAPLNVAVTLLPQEERTFTPMVLVSKDRPKKPKRTYLTPKKAAQYALDQARDAIEFQLKNSVRPGHVKEFRMIVATGLTKFAGELRSAAALNPKQGNGIGSRTRGTK
jgi:hypothetical protein